MNFYFDNERPIYVQIVEQLKLYILIGKFSLGERLPSVRDLALLCKVNPNTMQSALNILEDELLIYTERTNGKFVTNDQKLIKKLKENLAKTTVDIYLKDMEKIGFTKEEAIKYLKECK